jgi:hypothetical protein
VFGSETIWQKNHNAGIRALLESEEGTYATLQGAPDKELDAFLMQIGEYIFVEFSKTGNGAYAYRASDLVFNLHADSYAGSTSDLKCGYYRNGRGVAKIIHTPGWEERTAIELGKLGIHPDRTSARQEPARSRLSSEQAAALGKIGDLTQGAAHIASESLPADMYANVSSSITSPASKATDYTNSNFSATYSWSNHPNRLSPKLTVEQVHKIVAKYQGAQVIEKGGGLARRILWVTNPNAWSALDNELKKLGFQWAASRKSWYFRED